MSQDTPRRQIDTSCGPAPAFQPTPMRSGRQQEAVTHERARISFPDLAIPAEFQACFSAQRAAFLKAPEPSHAERLADLKALSRLIKENQAAIVAAIDADYGGRSEFETIFGEIFASLDGLRDAQKRLGRWMRPRRRSVDAAPLSRRAQSPDPAAHRRRRRDRAVELSDLPELRAAHRRACRGESGDGQDVGEFTSASSSSLPGFRRSTCPRTSSPSLPTGAAGGRRSRRCRSTISSSPGLGRPDGRSWLTPPAT